MLLVEANNTLRGLHNYSDHTKTESNYRAIIYSNKIRSTSKQYLPRLMFSGRFMFSYSSTSSCYLVIYYYQKANLIFETSGQSPRRSRADILLYIKWHFILLFDFSCSEQSSFIKTFVLLPS